MLIAATVLPSLLLLVLAGGALAWWRFHGPPRGRRVLLSLTDGSGIQGVLTACGPWITLADARLFSDNSTNPVRLDGTVYVERARVNFLQVIQ